jgi:integrase
MDIKWPKVKREPPDPLTADEKTKVLQCFAENEPYDYPFIRFQFEPGMRLSEPAALTWADINDEVRTVRINKSGYMGNDNDSSKTSKSGHIITISQALIGFDSELVKISSNFSLLYFY